MMIINLREEVAKALKVEWNGFAERHPRLAEAIDQTMLVEQAVTELADDPEYRQAMETAAAVQMGAGALSDLVQRWIGKWLRTLV